MPNDAMLDTLVKLAAAGTSGICILAIAMTGWVLYKADRSTSTEKYRTMRFYIGATVLIAIVSAVSGVMNARANATVIREEQEARERDSARAEVVLRVKEDSLVHLAASVDTLLRSPAIAAVARQSPGLNRRVIDLRNFIVPRPESMTPR